MDAGGVKGGGSVDCSWSYASIRLWKPDVVLPEPSAHAVPVRKFDTILPSVVSSERRTYDDHVEPTQYQGQ